MASRNLTRRGGALLATGTIATSGIATLLTLAGTAGATGATFTVDSAGDGVADASHCTNLATGDCTLRDAVAAAAAGDVITFAPSVALITLTQNTLSAAPISIVGPGAAALTITTAGAPGTYDLFNFSGTGDVAISGVTLERNRIVASNSGALMIDDLTVSGSSSASGGALYATNGGDVSITDSTFEGNLATSYGGAISVNANADDLTLTRCHVSGNTAAYGGGVALRASGDTTIVDSTISSNNAYASGGGGYVRVYGTQLLVERTTVDSNLSTYDGGGFYFCGAPASTIVVVDSTISNNVASGGSSQAGWGGGIFARTVDDLTIANSTLSGNDAPTGRAGALYIGHRTTAARILQSTITGNSAFENGGIGITGGEVDLSGSIVSANNATYSTATSDIGGGQHGLAHEYATILSDHSLVGVVSPPLTFDDVGGTVISNAPGLGPLADNGGPTRTLALTPTSPAIDAGPNPVAAFPFNTSDQRGAPYLRIYNGVADIGAFEVQPTPTPSTTTTGPEPVVPTFTG